MDAKQHKCFLSYNKHDREFVRALGTALIANDVDVWFDEWEVGPGDSIIDSVENGLRDCDIFVLVFSEKASVSNWVREELKSALNSRIESGAMKIIPLLLDDIELPPLIRDIKHVDFRGDPEASFTNLLQGIRNHTKSSLSIKEASRLRSLAPGLHLITVRVDSQACYWEGNGTDFYEHSAMYMKFIEVNDIVRDFSEIDDVDRRMFSLALGLLQRIAANNGETSVSPSDAGILQGISCEEFYKSIVLYNRCHGRKPMMNDSLFRDEARKCFSNYDIGLIPIITKLLSTFWPESLNEYSSRYTSDDLTLLGRFTWIFMRIADPIFDFIFVNNSTRTHIVHELDVFVEKVFTLIKAGPTAMSVKSLHTYEVLPLTFPGHNTFPLDPLLSVGSEQPLRFKVILKSFKRNCPGNEAVVSFSFRSNIATITSQSIALHF